LCSVQIRHSLFTITTLPQACPTGGRSYIGGCSQNVPQVALSLRRTFLLNSQFFFKKINIISKSFHQPHSDSHWTACGSRAVCCADMVKYISEKRRFGRPILYRTFEMTGLRVGTGRFGRLILYRAFEISGVQVGTGRFGRLILYRTFEMSGIRLGKGHSERLILFCALQMSGIRIGKGRFGRLILYRRFEVSDFE
jgi:hypothetical protein